MNMLLCLTFYILLASNTVQAQGTLTGLDECEEKFEKVGCYMDKTRPLPNLLLNNRAKLSEAWTDWENSTKRLVCSCASITRSKGCKYFGIQFYGECWGGVKPNVTYAHDGSSNGCVGNKLLPCKKSHPVCVGKARRNYIYKLITPTSTPDCTDDDNKCPEYARKGYCKKYANIQKQCPYSCKQC